MSFEQLDEFGFEVTSAMMWLKNLAMPHFRRSSYLIESDPRPHGRGYSMAALRASMPPHTVFIRYRQEKAPALMSAVH
jgi:hypothetical protein